MPRGSDQLGEYEQRENQRPTTPKPGGVNIGVPTARLGLKPGGVPKVPAPDGRDHENDS